MARSRIQRNMPSPGPWCAPRQAMRVRIRLAWTSCGGCRGRIRGRHRAPSPLAGSSSTANTAQPTPQQRSSPATCANTSYPNPSSCSRNSHWIPVCNTNNIPHSAARSSTRGRPLPPGPGRTAATSGSFRSHRPSHTPRRLLPLPHDTGSPTRINTSQGPRSISLGRRVVGATRHRPRHGPSAPRTPAHGRGDRRQTGLLIPPPDRLPLLTRCLLARRVPAAAQIPPSAIRYGSVSYKSARTNFGRSSPAKDGSGMGQKELVMREYKGQYRLSVASRDRAGGRYGRAVDEARRGAWWRLAQRDAGVA